MPREASYGPGPELGTHRHHCPDQRLSRKVLHRRRRHRLHGRAILPRSFPKVVSLSRKVTDACEDEEAPPGGSGAAPVEDASAPPRPASSDAEPPRKSVEERLEKLKRLHDKQLITDEEYEERKAAILEE